MTAQREALYRALCATRAHPTAEELYIGVRGTVPGLSLATVYNTLEMLVTAGFALKLPGDGPARYDATCDPHGHARCTVCGAVLDLPAACAIGGLDGMPMPDGFLPHALNLEITGQCKGCRPATRVTE